MRFSSVLIGAVAALLSSSTSAVPLEARDIVYNPPYSSTAWSNGRVTQYPIHSSCNATQTALLRKAFQETEILAQHAKEHILRFGNSSQFYQKWFGAGHTAEPAGWFEKVVNNDKTKLLFRCDDIDGNCKLPGYGGHWRGKNGSDETVICELSYTTRKQLEGLCGYGYTISGGSTTLFWAGDLLHRLFHTATIGEGVVEHYADTYSECLELAKTTPEEAIRNSASLRYFALDVYAFDLQIPGIGCSGNATVTPITKSSSAAATATGSATGSTSRASTAVTTGGTTASAASAFVTSRSGTATSSASQNCHTHANGELHCV